MKRQICFAVFALVTMFSTFSEPQTIIDYDRSTFTGTYQTITGIPGPLGDNSTENYSLPFTFNYIGNDYTEVRICTNGWIELGSAAHPLSFSNSLYGGDLFSISEPNKTLAPWMYDLGAFNYPVEYTTLGSFPNRVFVVQWRDVNSPYYLTRLLNFQVRLYETTNIIEFWYGEVSGSGDIEYASFGIEDEIGGSSHFIDGPTGSNTVGTINLNSYNNWPLLFYRFSPAPVKVVRPNGGEFFSIGYMDSIKWTSTVNDVKIEYSTDSGNNWNIIENSIPAASGKYAWMLPNTPSENSLVKISDAVNDSIFDVSDKVFTISEPPGLTVLPDSFYFIINEGDSIQSIIQISNTGLGNLQYEVAIENLSDQSKKLKVKSLSSSSTSWKDNFIQAQAHSEKNQKRTITENIFPELVLPLIISDPIGDGGSVDIAQIRGRSTSENVQLEFIYETDFNPFDFGGFLGLDIDQDILTGIPLPYGLLEQELGCEYIIQLYAIGSNLIYIYDQFNNYIGSFPAEFDLHSFKFSISLSSLSNDDGVMNLAAVVGNASGPTDWIPDYGYGVLGGSLWLTINPLSGMISPGGSEELMVKIKTDNIDGGEFYANILVTSNDPLNHQVALPVHLTVIGEPNLVVPDTINFGQVFVGYPKTIIAGLRNNGSVTLEVSDILSSNSIFSIQGPTNFSIIPSEIYSLPIIFSPTNENFEIGTLTIISNDLSSPEIINLKGQGIFPAAISVSPDSFFYDLRVGDSIVTNLTIENSGLGELIFQISDRMIAGRISTKINQNYLHHRSSSKEKSRLFDFDQANFPKIMTKEKVNSDLSFVAATDDLMPLLPLLITDIIGDGGITDIKEIRGRIFNGNLEIEYIFADDINVSDSIIAELALDVDRNPMTGVTDPFHFHDLGVDYYVDYYPLYLGNEVLIYEYSTGNSYTIPYTRNVTTISYSIPLSLLGNDDGEMDLLALCAYDPFGVLDWAPDEGHATLFNVFWLSEDPTFGVIPSGGNMTVEIRANTSNLIGGNYFASIDFQSNDPVNPVVGVPFTLHLTGIPQIAVSSDSLNFGETNIGYYNSLSLSISSTGTDSLFGNIFSSDPRFVPLDSVFALPVGEVKNIEVRFYPLAVGTYTAQININSNTSSSPLTISLTGEGVIAPNISTNTSLLEFQGSTGDTLRSNFIIYNTGGSDLTVAISDEVSNRAHSSERLFGVRENMIYEINPDNGQVMNSFQTPFSANFASGLAFSGEYLFFTDGDYTQNIFVLDPQNGNIITSYPSQSSYCDGLAYIDPYLYVSQNYSTAITVLNPLNGNLVEIINAQAPIWGGLDGGGDRLFASDNIILYELNPHNGSIINSFYTNNSIYGIGFTLESIFTSVTWGGIDEYDPNTGNFIQTISTTGYAGLAGGGNRDADWLSENPVQVTIPAGDSVNISLVIISPVDSGHYSADIILESNDPDSSIARLQVVLDVITGVDEENYLPKVYSLHNNFPNPFNPATTISYDLPRQGIVSLKVYNIVGEEIATLVNAEQSAGRYKIDWNASELASGVYFYRIQAAEFVDVKKMILMK